jgi:hypothetical protein
MVRQEILQVPVLASPHGYAWSTALVVTGEFTTAEGCPPADGREDHLIHVTSVPSRPS